MYKGKYVWLLFMLGLLALACSPQERRAGGDSPAGSQEKQLPRVLMITTGLEGQNASLPKGIVIALQAFNQRGALVRLEHRDILYEPSRLNDYNMIILSTAPGYHDADRRYSLSFMSAEEMENIRSFVHEGGVLISGDHVGRNMIDGTDRITFHGRLSSDVYPLANTFGLGLSERNMEGYQIYGHICGGEPAILRPEAGDNYFTLVPDTIWSDAAEVMASWVNAKDTLPAIVKNRYGKGTAYLLASSDFLHPAGEGGFMSTNKITSFYTNLVDDFHEQNRIPLSLNPWPHGHDYAFGVTLNAEGDINQYERVHALLQQHNIDPLFFVAGNVEDEVMAWMRNRNIAIESRGYDFTSYRNFNYARAVQDIFRNETHWGKSFTGFRFPFTMPGFWGLVALSEQGYIFESSIGANNLEYIHGSVVPHNIVMADDGFYKSTDIIELSPVYHDDYHFLKDISDDSRQQARELFKKTMIYEKYLENYWELAVKPYHGLMLFQGHPRYVAYNDTTLNALENTIELVRQDNTWIASAREIATFQKNMQRMKFYVRDEQSRLTVFIEAPEGVSLQHVTFNLAFKPESVNAIYGKPSILKDASGYRIVAEATNNQEITIVKGAQ